MNTSAKLNSAPPVLHHHHVPGLLQTWAIMAYQSSLLLVLLISSLLGDSFHGTKLFRLSVYFVHCLPLLLIPQNFPLNILLFYFVKCLRIVNEAEVQVLLYLNRPFHEGLREKMAFLVPLSAIHPLVLT